MKPKAWVVIALTAIILSGCFDERKPELTVFRVDELRHWFEGDRLVVNVTITNQVNFTPRGIFPELEVWVREWQAKPGSHDPGEETRGVASRWFSLFLMPPGAGPYDGERERWVFEDFIQDSSDSSALADNGPMLIPPGTSLTREFEFPIKNTYYRNQGHYTIEIRHTGMFSTGYYEDEFRPRTRGAFYGGCFNFDTPEFYGVVKGGLDCYYWDCTGLTSSDGYKTHRGIKESYKPDCSATSATGPDYSM
jgi:hypothetical protein